jgi:hypothetical protein
MFRQLTDPPGGEAALGRKRDIIARALTLLVTRGHYGLAHELMALTGLPEWDWVAGADVPAAGAVARDALYCLAILEVQPGGDAGKALGYLRRVRQARGEAAPGPDLLADVISSEQRLLREAGRPEEADALREQYEGRREKAAAVA